MKTIFRTLLLFFLATVSSTAELVQAIDLDKALNSFTATAKAMPDVDANEAANIERRIQIFVTNFTKSLNDAKIIKSPLTIAYQADGSFIGFKDSNRNAEKDVDDKDLFKIELFPKEKKMIASDLVHPENRVIKVHEPKPKIIKPGDILHIQTPYNEGRAPTQRDSLYIVSKDNLVNLGKGLGVTSTKNLSIEDLEKFIANFFNFKKPFPAIKVTIIIQKANGKNIQMLGNLKKPTTLNFKNGLNLKLAMNQCDGPTSFTATNRIQLIRNQTITLISLRKQKAKDITLQSGDILYFPQKRWIGK